MRKLLPIIATSLLLIASGCGGDSEGGDRDDFDPGQRSLSEIAAALCDEQSETALPFDPTGRDFGRDEASETALPEDSAVTTACL